MSTMISAPRKSGHLCNCGCSDCKGDCCELDCLVQPRFFCGQLLTDQDLSAMLEWVKGKTALARYRQGWGAVCGLEVHCDAKSGEEAYVSVMPGYAVDCCGNDILVCKEDRIDLAKYGKPEEDPCGDWPPPQPEAVDHTMLDFSGWRIPKSEVQAVDLFVRYAETLSDARTALAKGGCSPVETCEYTRTQESYEVYAKRADYCEQSADKLAVDWEEGYRKGIKELFESLPSEHKPDDSRTTISRLLDWLKNHPLRSFCFIREWLCELQRNGNPLDNSTFARIIFWLIQDWRNNYFRCDCFGCGPNSGVPIARVWLWRQKGERGKQTWKVVYINSHPPFRRLMQAECRPARSGAINLARFIWQPLDSVYKELRGLGFDQIGVEPFTFANLNQLKEQLGNDRLFVQRMEHKTDALVMYFYTDNCEQRRVVRFGVGTALTGTRIEEPPALPVADGDAPPPDDSSLALDDVPHVADAGGSRPIQQASKKSNRPRVDRSRNRA